MSSFANWTPEMVERHNQRIKASGTNSRLLCPDCAGEHWDKAIGGSLSGPCMNCGKEMHLHDIPTIAKAKISASVSEVEKLNKTEREFLHWLEAQDFTMISVQSVTLKLGDDCRYTPDFMTITPLGNIGFWEVKGFFRDDAKVKIKVAARMYRQLGTFTLVFKEKGQFRMEDVKP